MIKKFKQFIKENAESVTKEEFIDTLLNLSTLDVLSGVLSKSK